MNKKTKGLLIAIKILSILFTAFSFVTGIFLAIVNSYVTVSYSDYGYFAHFNSSIFLILLVIVFVYEAIPVLMTIMSSNINKNRRLIMPSFIMVLAMMPIGGYLGLASIFSSSVSGITIYSSTSSRSGTVLPIITFVLLVLFILISIALLILLCVCLMADRAEPNCVNNEKSQIIEELVSGGESGLSKSLEAITKSKELFDAGILTEEEFQAIKAKLL